MNEFIIFPIHTIKPPHGGFFVYKRDTHIGVKFLCKFYYIVNEGVHYEESRYFYLNCNRIIS